MSRGDKRDRDRAKRQAKDAAKGKGAQREGTPLQRNEGDKAALEAKLAAKAAKKEAEAAAQAGGGAPIAAVKKTPKRQTTTWTIC